jgi:hypothetical protein
MELVKVRTKSKSTICPLGDVQWSGKSGPTAASIVKRHIEKALAMDDPWFIGLGDYIDFLSPSNRQRLTQAALYDTAQDVIDEKAHELVQEVYEEVLAPTRGRWIGLLEGHHLYEGQGSTSDMWLAEMLECPFLGTSCYVQLNPSGVVLWAHHGQGNSVLPTGPLNKLYHVSHGLVGADVYLIGHTTKLSVARLSRPQPDWDKAVPDLNHSDIFLVNTGGFSRSTIVGHKHGRIVRGDYAEVKMLTPSPLSAPFVHVDAKAAKGARVRVEV